MTSKSILKKRNVHSTKQKLTEYFPEGFGFCIFVHQTFIFYLLNTMKKLFVPFVACVLAACSSNEQQATSYDVIPLPQEITLSQESPFKLSKSTVIAYPKDNDLLKRNAEFLAGYIAEATGYTLKTQAIENGEKPRRHQHIRTPVQRMEQENKNCKRICFFPACPHLCAKRLRAMGFGHAQFQTDTGENAGA